MAEPARTGAPHPGSGRSDIRETVLRLVAAATEASSGAFAELARHPECTAALRRAEALADGLGALSDLVRGFMLDETVLADAEARAYARGVADCKAARCRLEVIAGG